MIRRRGQGLLEMVIALGIISVSLFTTLGLIFTTLHTAQVSKNQILARNLAREGVEVVRAIRDTNWLKFDSGEDVQWNAALFDLGADYSAVPSLDPNTGAWTLLFAPEVSDLQGTPTILYRDLASGIYSQFLSGSIPGTPYNFQPSNYWRILLLKPVCWPRNVLNRLDPSGEMIVDETQECSSLGATYTQVGIEVTSRVRWKEQRVTHDVDLVEHIYNWKS